MVSEAVKTVKHQWWVHEAQADTETFQLGVTAGLGSGKSHGACQWFHDRCILNGRGISAFSTLTDQKIKDSLLPTYKAVLTDYGLVENEDYKILKSPHPKLIYPSLDHEVHFLSAETAKNIVAVQYTHACVSEAGSTSEDVAIRLSERLARRVLPASQLLLEGVPQGINWYADWFDDKGKSAKQWEALDKERQDFFNATRNRRRFRLTTYDNPFVPAQYIENLLNIYEGNPTYIQCWIFGHFVNLTKGAVCTGYSAERTLIEDCEPDPYLPIWWSLDFNANPLAFVIAQERREFSYTENKQNREMVAMFDSSSGPSNLSSAVAEFCDYVDIEIYSKTEIRIVGDMSGNSKSHKTAAIGATDYTELKRLLHLKGFKNVVIDAEKSNPSESESAEQLNRALRSGYHKICKRCTNYQRSLISTQWQDNQRKVKKGANDDVTHWFDAGKYLIWKLLKGKGKILVNNG